MASSLIKKNVGTNNIPFSILSLSSLPRISYVDQFTLPTSTTATPEAWARCMFGNTPSLGAIFLWRCLLGLRLDHRRSPSTVAGWKVGARGEDFIRPEASSWFLEGNLVVVRSDGFVSLVTFLFYRKWLGYVVWPVLSAIHRRLVPGILRKAESRIWLSQ